MSSLNENWDSCNQTARDIYKYIYIFFNLQFQFRCHHHHFHCHPPPPTDLLTYFGTSQNLRCISQWLYLNSRKKQNMLQHALVYLRSLLYSRISNNRPHLITYRKFSNQYFIKFLKNWNDSDQFQFQFSFIIIQF